MKNKLYKQSGFWLAMLNLGVAILNLIQGTLLSYIASAVWLVSCGIWLYKANKTANEKQQKNISTN